MDKGLQFSGSYVGEGVSSEILELRIDWDPISEHAKGLHMLSGDVFIEKKWQMSFLIKNPVLEKANGNTVKITGSGKVWDTKKKVSIEVLIEKGEGNAVIATTNLTIDGNQKSFTCIRYSKFFRTVSIEIDFTSDKLYLPTYNTHLHPSHPAFLPNRDIDLFSAYADAGIDLRLDNEQCTLVSDPDPNTAWTNSELYEIQEKELEGEDPTKWKIWAIITEKYAQGSSIVGAMFDTKTRQGFGLFTQAGLLSNLPPNLPKAFDSWPELTNQQKLALRHYLFSAVHECGHAFNLQHCFSLGRPSSLTWMNYASAYNRTNGNDAFFRNFEFAFAEVELIWLRHGPYNKVKPGEGNWGKLSPAAIPAALDSDDPDSWGKLLSFDIRLSKKKYEQMEPIALECRLRNTSTHSIFVEMGFSPQYDIVKIYVTRPSGEIEQVNSIKSQDLIEPNKQLYPQGSRDGPDRSSELVLLHYEADGFIFKDPGSYSVVAIYSSGAKELISNTVTLDVLPFSGKKSKEILERFFQDDVGRYIAIGGSRSAKYDEARDFLESLSMNAQNGYWAGALVAETYDSYIKDYKLVNSAKQEGKITVKTLTPPDYGKLIKATDAALRYYTTKGRREDNLLYAHVVLQRAKLHLAAHELDKAKVEVEEALKFMQRRGLKRFVVDKIKKIWLEMSNQAMPEVFDAKTITKNIFFFQDKNFDPSDTAYGDRHREFTLKLGEVFSQFNEIHLAASTMVVNNLFNLADETEDLKSVIDYVYELQHGRMHNQEMIKFAFALFVIHHPLARKAGLRYPENTTPAKPTPFLETRPTGPPDESWMNYWRNDSEFVYHHDHWHNVYVGRSLPSSTGTHLDRQGELFGYMHQQMLARYDAERQAQGLPVVVPYEFDETEPEGCDLRPIFTDPRFLPRPPGMRWNDNNIQQFRQWDYALNSVVQTGQIVGPTVGQITLRGPQVNTSYFGPNYFGHIVEPTTSIFSPYYGNLHNEGHIVFGSIGQSQGRSYMLSPAAAVRDPIFFRWHKRVDTYIERFSNTLSTELATDAPPVKITANDILITQSSSPPANFGEYQGSSWVHNGFTSEDVLTELSPARFEGEFGKLTHKPYTYHIRVARSDHSNMSSPLYLTIRIFICPANASEDIRRWIEMDKFRFILPAGNISGVITRQDKHSSVIRRNPQDMEGDIDSSTTVSGFCECGWPYSMLFPCGLPDGEPYKICVFISDNNIDQQGIRTHCGSLSYCGAQGQRYPDQRQMGYPFATPILVNGRPSSIQEAALQLNNMAIDNFKIVNIDTRFGPVEPTPTPSPAPSTPVKVYAKVAWYAQDQLTISRQSPYFPSQWNGVFRVLISGSNIMATGDSIVVQFEGRGKGNGTYTIKNANIGKRRAGSLAIFGQFIPITFAESREEQTAVIPEEGTRSLPIQIAFEEDEDYFVTFQVLQPSCYLRNPGKNGQSLYSTSGGDKLAKLADWRGAYEAVVQNIYGLSKVLVPESLS